MIFHLCSISLDHRNDSDVNRYYHNKETGESEWAEDVENKSGKTPPPGTPQTLSVFPSRTALDKHKQGVGTAVL